MMFETEKKVWSLEVLILIFVDVSKIDLFSIETLLIYPIFFSVIKHAGV